MIRCRSVLRGVVQGVGFRPHVARVASGFRVSGFCGNDDESVFIEAQGEEAEVEAFLGAVREDLPPLARVTVAEVFEVDVVSGERGFRIVESRRSPGMLTLVPPDIARCDDCLREMNDPSDRRYGYPFISCTNCGPRFSIIRDVPYDRALTTLAEFPMCEACEAEYTDPLDRRYHAEPISCFDCGPKLWLQMTGSGEARQLGSTTSVGSGETGQAGFPVRPRLAELFGRTRLPGLADSSQVGQYRSVGLVGLVEQAGSSEAFGQGKYPEWSEAIAEAQRLLDAGLIVAVKGVGGFALFCDARNETAVARLRERKHRPGKPLAVMAGSEEVAASFACFSAEQRHELLSPQRPIVLAPQANDYDLAPSVAPGLDEVGVMLPNAPLHDLLLGPNRVCVATSGNRSGEPLCYGNDDALRDLSDIADAFLMNNRDIHVPVEDSVLMADGDGVLPVRRSRGFAPLPITLGIPTGTVLAVGGEVKNTFTLTRDGLAFVSAHIGDMGALATQRAFERSVTQLVTAHRHEPELLVADLHPSYSTSAWAERYSDAHDTELFRVQHHHAHALSLLAEHGMTETPVLCAVFDGTGYGEDGTVWGGELLRVGGLSAERVWNLPTFWLPGGDSAVRNPWKCAVALLHEYSIDDADLPPVLAADPGELALVRSQLSHETAVVRTSSAGRLFDAVASLLGIRHRISYEAQAAMELERVARECEHAEHARFECDNLAELVAWLVAGVRAGRPVGCLARGFHSALAGLTARALASLIDGGDTVGLTGGVFQNRMLAREVSTRVHELVPGLRVLTHSLVPANDGGLSLGQAAAGQLLLARARAEAGSTRAELAPIVSVQAATMQVQVEQAGIRRPETEAHESFVSQKEGGRECA